MTTQKIIDNKIKEIQSKYPDWVKPEDKEVYIFSIEQVEEMIEEARKEDFEMFEKIIDDFYKEFGNPILRDWLKDKLKEKKEK